MGKDKIITGVKVSDQLKRAKKILQEVVIPQNQEYDNLKQVTKAIKKPIV